MRRLKIHIAYVIGTRPEAIRSARLLSLLEADSEATLTLINTGQHYDWNMLGGFLEELDAPPVSVDLEVGHSDPPAQIGEIVGKLGPVLEAHRPDALCVFGDTNSSLAGAIAAVKTDVPLVHIEAGCRSFDMRMPEEINRRLIDHMAGLLLAVSGVGRDNLEREQVLGRVEVVGDPQFDVFSRQAAGAPQEADRAGHGLITLHRPQNVDDPAILRSILGQLAQVSEDAGIRWTFPVHPRTRRTLEAPGLEGIELVDPMLYGDLLVALRKASVCVTDSGGLQKEALWMRVPCVTIRDSTEWLETIWQGANALAPPGSDIAGTIVAAIERDDADFSNPYGDGRASESIGEAIGRWIRDGAAFPWPLDRDVTGAESVRS